MPEFFGPDARLDLRSVLNREPQAFPPGEPTPGKDIQGSIAVTRRAGDLLAPAGLAQVVEFNNLYCNVTEVVAKGVDEGIFEHPEDVLRTVPIFVQLYIDPLINYLNGDLDAIPPAWLILLEGRGADEDILPGIQFLLGMNAHIRRDLPEALRQSGVGPGYRRDYRRVIRIILREVASDWSERYIHGPKTSRKLVTAGTLALIGYWRGGSKLCGGSWDDGMDLMDAETDVERELIYTALDRKSVRSGEWIVGPGNVALSGLNRMFPRSEADSASDLWVPRP